MKKKQDDYFYITSLIIMGIIIIGTILYKMYFYKFITISECLFYSKYGIFCPGCGCTRAFIALLQGNLIQSFLYNPTVLYATIMTAVYIITQTIARITKKKVWALTYKPIYLYIGITILLITCLIKNIVKFIG